MKHTALITCAMLCMLSLSYCKRISFMYTDNQTPALSKTAQREIDLFAEDLLISALPLTFTDNSNSETTCNFCKNTITSIREYIVNKHGFQGFYKFVTNICSHFLDADVCSSAVAGYAPIFVENLVEDFLDEVHFCAKINLCADDAEYLNADDYARELLKDKPSKTKEAINKSAPVMKMLQLTDPHFDLYYKQGASADCSKPLCCRDTPGADYTGDVAGKFGYPGKCDINENVFRSFMTEVMEQKPDFIVWTGDNAPHDIWMGSQDHVFESTKKLRDLLNEYVKGTIPVYPILGNHEKYPNDEYSKNEKELLTGMANLYKEYLDDQAYNQFKSTGYYTMKHKDTKLRMVALNCMMCDTLNFHLITDQSDAQKMFAWLETVLRKAEADGEFVYILDHIPINANFYLTECGLRLKAILDRFNYIIRGHISGHTHYDDIVAVHSYFDDSKIISMNYVAPPLTTYSHHYPSFRVFDIDSSTMNLIDYRQYRLNVTDANQKGEADWFLAYTASEFYDVKDLSDMKKMAKKKVKGKYIEYRYGQTKEAIEKSTDKKEIKKAECTIKSDNFAAFYDCAYNKISISMDFLFSLLNKFCGKWKKL